MCWSGYLFQRLGSSQFFAQGAAAGGADADAFAVKFHELEVWFLAARNLDVGVAHMVRADGGFVAEGTGHAHTIDTLEVIDYTV